MAVPTIATVSPSTVWTGGQLVVVTGTGFRLPDPPPAANAPLPAPTPTVGVLVDGVAARNVRVLSATQLTCLVEPRDPGTVGVLVRNLDNAGVPIPGETVTKTNALTYARPKLDATVVVDSDRVTRQVLLELRRQVLENTVMFVHTDFEVDLGSAVEFAHIATVPALAVVGPSCAQDREYAINRGEDIAVDADTYGQHSPWLTQRLTYTLVGIANTVGHTQALKALVLLFFDRNPYLAVQRDPADAGAGVVHYELEVPLAATLQDTSRANPDNLRTFTLEFAVRGVNLEHVAGFPGESLAETGGVVDDVALTAQGVD